MPGPLTPYPGIDPVTISTTPGAGAGGVVVNDSTHGRVAVPPIVNGNNDVTAGNIVAAVQALQNTINWILRRVPDLINGGIYTYVAVVTLLNQFFFNGGVSISNPGFFRLRSTMNKSFVGNGSTLYIGDPDDRDGDGALVVHTRSPVTFEDGTHLAMGGSTTYTGYGWRANRKAVVLDVATGFPGEAWDTVWCYNTSGTGYAIDLSNPNTAGPGGTPLTEGIRVTFVVPGKTGSWSGTLPQAVNTAGSVVDIRDHSSTLLVELGYTATVKVKSVTLETVAPSGAVVWDVVSYTLFT